MLLCSCVCVFVCARVHLSLQASVCVFPVSHICICLLCFHLSPLLLCYCVCLRPLCLGSSQRWDSFGCWCIFLLRQWHHSVIQRARGSRLSHCAESENYYASLKNRLHCCSTGIPLCSRSVTHCLLTNPQCKSRQSTSTRLCCGAVEAACSEECWFIASKISCNGWLRRGGVSDYTDNYKTWECWKQLCVIMPWATGDMLVQGSCLYPYILEMNDVVFNSDTLKFPFKKKSNRVNVFIII